MNIDTHIYNLNYSTSYLILFGCSRVEISFLDLYPSGVECFRVCEWCVYRSRLLSFPRSEWYAGREMEGCCGEICKAVMEAALYEIKYSKKISANTIDIFDDTWPVFRSDILLLRFQLANQFENQGFLK